MGSNEANFSFGNQILNKHDSSAQVPVADARSVKLKQNIVIIRFYSVQPSLANSFHIILGPDLQNFKERFFSRKRCFSNLLQPFSYSMFDGG